MLFISLRTQRLLRVRLRFLPTPTAPHRTAWCPGTPHTFGGWDYKRWLAKRGALPRAEGRSPRGLGRVGRTERRAGNGASGRHRSSLRPEVKLRGRGSVSACWDEAGGAPRPKLCAASHPGAFADRFIFLRSEGSGGWEPPLEEDGHAAPARIRACTRPHPQVRLKTRLNSRVLESAGSKPESIVPRARGGAPAGSFKSSLPRPRGRACSQRVRPENAARGREFRGPPRLRVGMATPPALPGRSRSRGAPPRSSSHVGWPQPVRPSRSQRAWRAAPASPRRPHPQSRVRARWPACAGLVWFVDPSGGVVTSPRGNQTGFSPCGCSAAPPLHQQLPLVTGDHSSPLGSGLIGLWA